MLFFVAGCSYLLKFFVNIVVCCDGVLGEWKIRDFFFFWSSFGCFKNFPPNGKLELIQFESQLWFLTSSALSASKIHEEHEEQISYQKK